MRTKRLISTINLAVLPMVQRSDARGAGSREKEDPSLLQSSPNYFSIFYYNKIMKRYEFVRVILEPVSRASERI